MRLKATITIDIDATDFVEAAGHQRRIEALLTDMQQAYPAAGLDFRERRASRRGRQDVRMPRPVQAVTGRLSAYVD